MRQALDLAAANRIHDLNEDNRDSARRLLNGREGKAAVGHDDIRPERDQFCDVLTDAIGVDPGRAIIDPHIAAYSPAQRLQRVLERRMAGYRFRIIACEELKHADAPHLIGLLRARTERPRRRTTQQSYEIAPSHSATSWRAPAFVPV